MTLECVSVNLGRGGQLLWTNFLTDYPTNSRDQIGSPWPLLIILPQRLPVISSCKLHKLDNPRREPPRAASGPILGNGPCSSCCTHVRDYLFFWHPICRHFFPTVHAQNLAQNLLKLFRRSKIAYMKLYHTGNFVGGFYRAPEIFLTSFKTTA